MDDSEESIKTMHSSSVSQRLGASTKLPLENCEVQYMGALKQEMEIVTETQANTHTCTRT